LPGWEVDPLLASYATGLIAIVVVAALWLGVQLAWRRAFPSRCSDPDALAGRTSCHGCDGAGNCPPRKGVR